jgi:hypothetical protein
MVDEWDVEVLKTGRKAIRDNPHMLSTFDQNSDEDCIYVVTAFIYGGQYVGSSGHPEDSDSFGPWGFDPSNLTEIKCEPNKRVPVQEMTALFAGQSRYGVQVFYLDDDLEENPGGQWFARIWDNKLNHEVAGSKFVSRKLSWTLTAIALIKPLNN